MSGASDERTSWAPIFDELISVQVYSDGTSETCSVEVDQRGWFITVETDPYEGSAMMALPLAEKVYEAMGRAIEMAKARQRDLGQ